MQTTQNANLDDLAQRYAGAQAALEATRNYYHIHDTLSEYLDVTVAHTKELNQIADTDKKTDRVDANELAQKVRLNSVPESYVPTDVVREVRARVRGRQMLVENRTKYARFGEIDEEVFGGEALAVLVLLERSFDVSRKIGVREVCLGCWLCPALWDAESCGCFPTRNTAVRSYELSLAGNQNSRPLGA